MSELPRRLVDEIDDDEEASEGRRLLRAAKHDPAPSNRFTAAMAALGMSKDMTGNQATRPSVSAIWRLRWLVGTFLAGGVFVVGTSFVVSNRPSDDTAKAHTVPGTPDISTIEAPPLSKGNGPATAPAPELVTVDTLPDARPIQTSEVGNRNKRESAHVGAPSARPRPPASPPESGEADVAGNAKPTSGTGHDGLEAELALLKRARALVAAGNPAGALAALADYETTFTHGVLLPEAEVIRLECLESLGRKDEARARATSFLANHPNTPQTVRVAALLRRLQ